MNISQFLSFEGTPGLILLGALALVGLIGGWIFYPYSIGALTRAVRSPWKHFTERCGTAFVGAIAVAFVGYKVLHQPIPQAEVEKPVSDAVEPQPIPDRASKSEIPPPKEEATKVPAVAATKPPETLELPTKSVEIARQIEDSPKPSNAVTASPEASVPTERTKALPKESPDPTKAKVTELKAELTKVDSKIESERTRWTEARDTINQLTNFKKTPVKEGSAAYHRCMAASKVIQEVEAGASALKAEKARLEAVIKELEE